MTPTPSPHRRSTRLAIALLASAIVPAGAQALSKEHTHAYRTAYRQVARKLGKRAPGRNILRDGLSTGRAVSDRALVRSTAVLRRMLAAYSQHAPNMLVAATASSTSTAPASTTTTGLPACASESGTDYSTGPGNTNPSSGATGRYQIIPSTAAAYGCDLSTPKGQDDCAALIFRHQGAGAWVGCGG